MREGVEVGEVCANELHVWGGCEEDGAQGVQRGKESAGEERRQLGVRGGEERTGGGDVGGCGGGDGDASGGDEGRRRRR